MKTHRRKFPVDVEVAIIRRATDSSGRVHCERCGAWLPKRSDFEIDHVIAEAVRPDADKRRKLTPADGQLLCAARCHREKTGRDVGAVAEAKRREAAHFGAGAKRRKRDRPPLEKIAAGPTQIARSFKQT